MPLALLLTTATATAVGAAALFAAHGLRRQITALRADLADARAAAEAAGAVPTVPTVPHARTADATMAEEIRTAVAEALAEERERELAEARAFWAAQEARDATDSPASHLGDVPGALGDTGGDGPFFVPRQADFAGLESLDLDADYDTADLADYPDADLPGLPGLTGLLGGGLPEPGPTGDCPEYAEDSPELAAARRRHPSHPDFVPVRTPVVTDHERTVARLEELADARTALADVRPGPLGTLDVYVFEDGTTLCMTPGHRETSERLADALREGAEPFLLGGSGISGAYALTFSCGDGENVYILADRVIASL
ncbi:hypothetical protein [Streptomyces fradiae]|uniref:hypothetical protein n=1 Tax=Streptomyces fradiae TaxID=1906 RepID=UPI0035BE7D78